MGVHGLSGYLKRIGIDHSNNNNPTTSLFHNSSLAIDGNGLLFHLFRLSYYRHYKNVTSSNQNKSLQSQLLLPSFVPLTLAQEITTSYLSSLTIQHGIHLKIYFDGPNQYMKRLEKASRKERREDEWENVRQLCLNGVLPQTGASKFRSSARRQAREYELNNGEELPQEDRSDPLAEMYLSSFPISPLVMDQIERSIYAFEEMSPILSSGSIHIIECDGEADSEVAKASADDKSGKTYALACDSDYLIYGYANDCEHDGIGETKYLLFGQVDPSSDELCVGNALTRSNVAATIGLPISSAMVDLSILMGNDYTGPFVKHEDTKKRKEYWESLQWCHHGKEDCGDGERLPPESEMSWFDVEGIAEHVADKVGEGLKLTSDDEELRSAIEFSYALYSFGDISSFSSNATESNAVEEDDINVGAAIFPSLPLDLDLTLARDTSSDTDIVDAALSPMVSYKSNVGPDEDELQYIEQRHIDAFRMTLETMMLANPQRHVDSPRHKMRWVDIQALYVMEKCLLAAIEDFADVAPSNTFDHAIFHSCLESLSFDDFPLDNELVSRNEKSFLEEATEHPSIQETKDDGPLVLPIDEHKEEILHTVKTQRVTIIHGETGCGKSSRVPCFLLRADPPESTSTAPEVKMIVSQPRRIAAKALAERVRSCEPDLADKIGLRMGHGIREYETSKTRAWFVTTGYVVRLLANHPSWFDSHTHLIIDEVHERSVDTDILCLLCRRLLASHPTIRLVLMSATMAAELYSQYFGSSQPPIHVGARRFPIKEYFVEDLTKALSLPPKHAKLAQQVYEECEKLRCKSAPSSNSMERLYKLATQITSSVGDTGSSVLIFVPGMADIEALSELIESLRVPNVSFICLPIHSEVPFEEQMAAFEPPKAGEIKVIIATNAAESSLTLPDVDHVICLGLCKQITYNTASHRQMLVPTWISRASATQRAGRTGRVREGTVYRLYSKNAFREYMSPFEAGEMVRIPLDHVILSLKDMMLGEAITPILLECIEPPDIANIERSFRSLRESSFISSPSDEGDITSLGSLVVALGIDLTLGALVGLGIQFGVVAECIELAAILSFPKTPWAISSPMYHDTDTFNEIISKTFTSRCYFDAGSMSEPMGISNLLSSYSACQNRNNFIWKHRLSGTRMKHLYGTVQSLKQRVAECLGVKVDVLHVEEPPLTMHPAKMNILRILHVWLFHDTMIVHNTSKSKIECLDGGLNIELDGSPITREHLLQILDEERHQFQLRSCGKISQQVRFDPKETLSKESDRYFDAFDIRFASYTLEKEISLSYYSSTTNSGSLLKIFIPASVWEGEQGQDLRDAIIGRVSGSIIVEKAFLGNIGSGNQRGIRGRPCGAWHPASIDSILSADDTLPQRRVFVITCPHSKANRKEIQLIIDIEIAKSDSVKNAFCCTINQSKKRVLASIECTGECQKVSDTDLGDLFAAHVQMANLSKSAMRQRVFFPSKVDEVQNDKSALLTDAPEGARLMTVLASERRKDNFIRFSNDDESFVDVNVPKKFSINTNKWKRKSGGGMVFVPENCVPAAIIPNRSSPSVSSSLPSVLPPPILPPVDQGLEVFACCANTLDLRGGACRVDGISLMPPGRLFTGLALLCFGFHPRTGLPVDSDDDFTVEEKKEGDVDSILREATDWIFEKEGISVALEEDWRVLEALNFHKSCMELGELLECQPEKIQALCDIFDGISGPMAVWDGYDVSLTAKSASLRSRPVEKGPNNKKREDKKATSSARQNAIVPGCSKDVGAAIEARPSAAEVDANGTAGATNKVSLQKDALIKVKHERQPPLNKGRTVTAQIVTLQRNAPITTIEIEDHILKGRWGCPGCNSNVTFTKRNACVKHMKKCLFDVSEQPKQVFICKCCSRSFYKLKECRLHVMDCLGSSPNHALKLVEQSAAVTQASECDSSNTVAAAQTSKKKWECQGCKQSFAKRKICVQHMEQCLSDKNHVKPKPVFECQCCRTRFPKEFECNLHVKSCIGGSQDARPSIAEHKEFSANATTKQGEEKIQNNGLIRAAQQGRSRRQSNGLEMAKERWMCQCCNESFQRKRKCMKHMEECCFVLVKNATPREVFTCGGCKKNFATPKECQRHMKMKVCLRAAEKKCINHKH